MKNARRSHAAFGVALRVIRQKTKSTQDICVPCKKEDLAFNHRDRINCGSFKKHLESLKKRNNPKLNHGDHYEREQSSSNPSRSAKEEHLQL